MRIAVCIKQVPVVSALQFDPVSKTLKREGVRSETSSFDVRALLKAIELRAAHGGEVVVVTMGPPQAREALVEECDRLGADQAGTPRHENPLHLDLLPGITCARSPHVRTRST